MRTTETLCITGKRVQGAGSNRPASAAQNRAGLSCLLFFAFFALTAFGQEPPPTSPPPRVIIVNPGGPIVIRNGGQDIDPQTALAMQQNGLDMRVVAQAEFDPPVILPGDSSTYRVVVTAMIEGVSVPDKLPTPQGLELTATGRGFGYVGNPLQARTTLNFRATATAPGRYSMPPYAGSGNGKPVVIPPATLTVLAPGSPRPPRISPRLIAEVPAEDYYIGQIVPVSLVLLDPGDNSVQGGVQPTITGNAFILDSGLLGGRQEVREDQGRMVKAFINELSVIPIKEGPQSLYGQEMAVWNHSSTNAGITLPGYFPLVDSHSIVVTVKHLPKDGELPGFTGAIGTFRLDSPRVSTNTIRAGELLTLFVTVLGEGNLSRLRLPETASTTNWQTFPPVSDGAGPAQIQQRGAAVFLYTLIPLSDRIDATPAIPFSYFDPKQKKYFDLTIPPVPLRILPVERPVTESSPILSAIASAPATSSAVPEDSLAGLTHSRGWRASSLIPVQERAWFLGMQLAPAALLGLLVGWSRRRRFLEAHPEVVLKARARRGVRRQLRLARRAAATRDAVGFATAAVNAFRQVCAPHTAAEPAALVCADVLGALDPGERDGKDGKLVRTLFSATDEARFVSKPLDDAALLALLPDVENALGKWKERL